MGCRQTHRRIAVEREASDVHGEPPIENAMPRKICVIAEAVRAGGLTRIGVLAHIGMVRSKDFTKKRPVRVGHEAEEAF